MEQSCLLFYINSQPGVLRCKIQSEALLTSTKNICFRGEKGKNINTFFEKKNNKKHTKKTKQNKTKQNKKKKNKKKNK